MLLQKAKYALKAMIMLAAQGRVT